MQRALRTCVACVLALPASAQGSSSANFALEDPAVTGFGGPSASSDGATAFVTLPDLGSGELASPSFGSGGGFLETNEPAWPDAPTVFGLTPPLGPKAGGTVLTLSGVHFDYLGSGPSVQVFLDGVEASGVAVLSDTTLTCVVPAGAAGPLDVDVTSAFGTGTSPAAFLATPAVVAPAGALVGESLALRNVGPAGALFVTYWSVAPTSIPVAPFGTLELLPPLYTAVAPTVYAANGEHHLTAPVPDKPALLGATLYFQTLAVASLDPLEAEFTNSSATTLQ